MLEIFRRNNVAGILATSRPNKGTHQLMDAKAPGLWVVPFIRPYRIRADIQTWFNDPATWELIQEEYKRGYHRGIGEFHIYGNSAASPLVKQIVDFAVERDLYLHAHCDEAALLLLLRAQPRRPRSSGRIPASRPRRRGCASYWRPIRRSWASSPTAAASPKAAARCRPEWRELFARYSDRFLLGSDTWINERWFGYDSHDEGLP